jgi:predicted O-linked N-acetylglucosamine transferase (SPINDLY family)
MSLVAENSLLNNCWQAGIDRVLAGQQEEAQVIWLSPFLDDETSIDAEQLTQSLINYLSGAANQKLATGEKQQAYLLAQCLCAVAPDNINSLLQLAIQADDFELEFLADNALIEVLTQDEFLDIDLDLIYLLTQKVARLITERNTNTYLRFINLLANKVTNKLDLVNILAAHSFELGQCNGLTRLRTQILEVCLEYAPAALRFAVLCDLAGSTAKEQNYRKSIAIGEQCAQEGAKIGVMEQVCGSYRQLGALMEAGEWSKIMTVSAQHKQNLEQFIAAKQQITADMTISGTPYFLNYLYDEPRILHKFRNAIGDICSKSVLALRQPSVTNQNYQSPPKNGLLRIGYIASTLNCHSVGWLSRWLFHYHDRSKLQIFIYHVGQVDGQAFNQKYFRSKVDVAHYVGNDAEEIADLIKQDEIDILIDLDSLSMSVTYKVMCYKPAPVSVTWLGWDTSGCPEVDYFIADPYVLPTDAEEYYRSKIWRLPQTYIAIDGFEIEVPTKRRSDYQIPEDSIVYLCAQKSYKHHPDILRLQMQIIKQVPNSYLMVQLRANPESLIKTYQELADEVGISMEQLRFIQPDPDEMTHRANLQLADVVLDTFPYNGATTTLETLWMGVPMVTKVGQAFVARNSYAFMQNVGVTEGIAHTDAEYIDWGVRLGNDLALRQQVMGKLLNSRKTSPLWDAHSFTLEMEQAYHQMWEIHQSK